MQRLAYASALLVLALAPAAAAEEQEIDDAYVDAVIERMESTPTLHGELSLSLADAIAMGLQNNLDVEVERHEPLIARENVGVAWGAFDPELFSGINYVDSRTPTSNVLVLASPNDSQIIKSKQEPEGSVGLRGILPLLGSEYSVEFAGSEATTDSAITGLSPELNSSFNLSFSQPLLRDLIWNEPWTRVKTNQIVAETSLQNFRAAVMDVVERIEKAYWDLIARDDEVRVAQKSLEFAEAQRGQTQTQYDVGVVSKVDVVEAEAGVAERELTLIRARNAYRNAQDVLIDLVLGAGLRAESTLEIEPTDRPDEYVPYEIDVPAAVRKAFRLRPEVRAALREIERQEVQLKFAKNQRLPQVDFNLNYGLAGNAGDVNPNVLTFGGGPTPTNADLPRRTFGDTFDIWEDANSLTVGGSLSIPIPNRSARRTVSRTELELRRAKVRRRRLEQSIVLDVRSKARNLEAAQEGIEAAERRRLAAEEQLRAERIRLEYGESTPFDVLLRERDLVEAETQKIGALQVYRFSVTELDRAQGTILRSRNVRIDEVSALRLDVR
jgi:outer membrane protein TolC